MMLTYYCKRYISINKKQWPATSLVGIRKKHSVSAHPLQASFTRFFKTLQVKWMDDNIRVTTPFFYHISISKMHFAISSNATN